MFFAVLYADMSNREADIEMNNTNKIGNNSNNDATTHVEGYDGSDDALCGNWILIFIIIIDQ